MSTQPKPRSARARLTHAEIVALIDRVEAWGKNPESVSNSDDIGYHLNRTGTSTEYSIDRLVRHRPDIVERLRSGEFRSVNEAMVEAGMVDRLAAIPSGNAERAAGTILRQCRPEVAAEIARLIMDNLEGTK